MASEADTQANCIDLTLHAAGWQQNNITQEHCFAAGRKMSGGASGRRYFVNYPLHKEDRYLSVEKAKQESEHATKGS